MNDILDKTRGSIMNEDMTLTIQIPSDDDGYVLLKCPNCGSFFKATASDIQDEGLLALYCPCCGLTSDSYITEDVLTLAITMAKNSAMDMAYDMLKQMERQFHGGLLSFKAGKPPAHEPESPITSGIEALVITMFSCCKRSAKIKPLLKMTGCYCPFCGVKNYEVE